jgi:hypothetical protein
VATRAGWGFVAPPEDIVLLLLLEAVWSAAEEGPGVLYEEPGGDAEEDNAGFELRCT